MREMLEKMKKLQKEKDGLKLIGYKEGAFYVFPNYTEMLTYITSVKISQPEQDGGIYASPECEIHESELLEDFLMYAFFQRDGYWMRDYMFPGRDVALTCWG